MTLEICTGLTVGRRGKVTSEVPRSRIATYKTVISCDQDIITLIHSSFGFHMVFDFNHFPTKLLTTQDLKS